MTKVLIGQQVKYILRTIQIKNKHLDEILGQLIKYILRSIQIKTKHLHEIQYNIQHRLGKPKICRRKKTKA
jgi:hypothetical protein